MELKNLQRTDNIVKLKDGVKTFEHGVTIFEPETNYRSLMLTNGKQKEVLVYGEIFQGKDFDKLFRIL